MVLSEESTEKVPLDIVYIELLAEMASYACVDLTPDVTVQCRDVVYFSRPELIPLDMRSTSTDMFNHNLHHRCSFPQPSRHHRQEP